MLKRVYSGLLQLYPAHFQARYREQILQTLADRLQNPRAQSQRGEWALWASLFADLGWSVMEEQARSWFAFAVRNPVTCYSAVLAVALTAMGGAAAITVQQMLRRGANQPQYQIAESYVTQLQGAEREATMHRLASAAKVDMAESLEPFVIVYDDQGRPVNGTGRLDSAMPVPPRGVFEYVRREGNEAVTWAPHPEVRIAAVARRIGGAEPGFVLAGRSLREVEIYEGWLRQIAFGGWALTLFLVVGGGIAVQRARVRSV